MSYNIDNNIIRKKTKQISVGNVKIGGDALISIQSMTNTITEDVDATVNQIKSLEDEGADIVRVSCPNEESTKALNKIVNNVKVPIVADIHFHYKRALEAADAGAACLRVNPGNIGPERIKEVIAAAKANSISMRIGVNAGSLGKKIMEKYKEPGAEALVDSALENIKLLESNNFDNFKISVKASNVHTMVAAYEKLSALTDYPLHLGLTEAGTYISGSIKSSMSIGKLLSQGIGDTVRVSLTADPVEEIKIGYEILKSLDLRSRGVKIGKNCFIGHNSIIESNVIIGDNCSKGSNVIIRNTLIKNNVSILDGCIIGKKGFGFFPNQKKNVRYPHIGIVIIEDDCEIGCGSTIDRGSLSNTIIGKNTFLDNQVHVAHNNKIGDNCIIAGQVGFAGSSTLGNNVMVGGQAGISGHLKIGNNVQIAGGSGVIKNISDNSKVMGYPAKNLKNFIKENK